MTAHESHEQFERLIAQHREIFDIIEGEIIILKERLSIENVVLLSLVAAYLGHKLGKLDKETLGADEILRAGGVAYDFKRGSIDNVLSRLAKSGKIVREIKGEYKVTFARVIQLTKVVLPKLRSGEREIEV